MNETRICSVCGQEHSNRSGMKKKDGSFYISRKCYPCSKSNPGKRTKEERFWEYVDKKSWGCWEWTGGIDRHGYGRFGAETARSIGAHRYSYALHNGPFQKSLFVCHKCDNPKCVNPDHLFLGAHQDNMDDMKKKGRGRGLKGEQSPMAKLTEDDVIAIRKDNDSYRKIAEKHGVSTSLIGHIKNRRQWRHVK